MSTTAKGTFERPDHFQAHEGLWHDESGVTVYVRARLESASERDGGPPEKRVQVIGVDTRTWLPASIHDLRDDELSPESDEEGVELNRRRRVEDRAAELEAKGQGLLAEAVRELGYQRFDEWSHVRPHLPAEPVALTARVWRNMGPVLDRLRRDAAVAERGSMVRMVARHLYPERFREAVAEWEGSDLLAVADTVRVASTEGRPTVDAVMEELHYSKRTAERMIAKAVDAGLLPKRRRGQRRGTTSKAGE